MKMAVMIGAAVIAATLTSHGIAHEGATGVVKERMDAMKSIRDDMKQLRRVVRGRDDFNQADFLARVESIKSKTANITALFPEGSLQEPSEALPSVWENWDDFSMQANRFHERVISLEQAVEGNDLDQVKSAFRTASRSCKACHDDYKAD